MRRGGVVVCGALLALTGVACGGDDGDERSGDALTKAEFIVRADARCREYNDAAIEVLETAAVSQADAEADPEAYAELIIAEVLPLYREMLADVRALEPPAEDAETIQALFDDSEAALEATLDEVEEDPEVAVQDNERFDEIGDTMAAYGFDDCAGGGSADDEPVPGDDD